MTTFYYIGIKIYYFLIWFSSFFNSKAKNWIDGRKNWKEKYKAISNKSRIWFHFASLGEFEQGKPLLQATRNQYPDKEIIITFFSPSGYEIRKNSPLGDHILYLPIDIPKNAKDFITIFKPEIAIFNKYEYWYYFFAALQKNQIPIYITSAIFRPQQVFFRWYGGFNRKTLNFVSHFFIQNDLSGKLLESIGLKNFTLSGDTRFDSVLDLAKNKKYFPLIEAFKGDKKLLIAGSTWPQDEELLANYINKLDENWKVIIAPHEISEEKLKTLEKLTGDGFVRYSKLQTNQKTDFKVLIIDNIGMLSSIYQYAKIAYIGGGFGAGIHNTLEATAWGLPVVFGPKYHKFREAKDLITNGAGFSIQNEKELTSILDQLIGDEEYLNDCGSKAKSYVAQNTGATAIIIDKIF